MQEVTSAETKTSTIFDQLRSSVLVDTSSKSRAFSDFLGLMSQPAATTGTQSQGAVTQINSTLETSTGVCLPVAAALSVPLAQALEENSPVQSAADTLAATNGTAATNTASASIAAASASAGTSAVASAASAASATVASTSAASTASAAAGATASAAKKALSSQSRNAASETLSSTAKNAPVSREAFEKAKPLLAKAGVSDTEMADLAARVQAGSLTWGQLVQSVGNHMTGAKKTVALSASETTELQTTFQKLGFATDVSSQMAKSTASGDGLKALSSLQNKLETLQDDSTLGISKEQFSTFFKAMNVPGETAAKLTQLLGPESTVADMKNALAQISQAMQDQRAKTTASDTELAKSLGKLMKDDTAKAARDTKQTAEATSSSSDAKVGFELKTKDTNDTAWFDQREKTSQQKSGEKANDDAWRSFTSKVRADDTTQANAAAGAQQSAQATATAFAAGKESSLEAMARSAQSVNAQQGKAELAQQAKTVDKPLAPKVLDQVSEAMLKDLGQGRKQMTIQLDPENLGKAQVVLQVKGKEISALIQVEDSQTAAMLSSNMESLKKTLEDQGLTVQNLEVQAGLTSNQEKQTAFSADQHNQAQERQELSRLFSQLRMMRDDGGDMAPDMQNMHMQAILADQGLHIVA